MALQQHPCALSHYKVDLPPLPYSFQLGFSKLYQELENCEAKDLVGKYAFNFDCDQKTSLNSEEMNSLRWLMTPWMTFSEPFDKAMAIGLPFTFEFIHAHPSFWSRFVHPETKHIDAYAFISPEVMHKERTLHAIRHILKSVYGVKVYQQPQVIFINHDEDLGLPEFFSFTFDERFIDVQVLDGDPPPINEENLIKLRTDPNSSLEDWLELVPINRFAFKGFSLVSSTDVTTQEALAGIHRELQHGTLIDHNRLKNLQTFFQIFTRAPELTLRIYVPRKDNVLLISPKAEANAGCMLSNSVKIPKASLIGTQFYEVFSSPEQKWMSRIEYLEADFLKHLNQTYNEAVLLIPLIEGDEILGALELTLHERKHLLRSSPYVLSEMVLAITQALRRSMIDLQQRVQNIIQSHCTALHPSVVWRFENEARKYLEKAETANFSEIVFNNVFPLYSQSDIQSSSMFRNEAIRADLNLQLDLAAKALTAMNSDQEMPIYGEMLFRVEERKERLKGELHSSDELSIQQFLNRDIESIFREFGKEKQPAHQAIEAYQNQLDSKYGMVHIERGRYERAVTQINHEIMAMIDKEQISAQKMIPHYAEKTSTDGVELSLYLGKALLHNRSWSDLHLRNLRLWQLILTCRIARYCEAKVPELELPLRMTHLVLVQDMPLTIRFSTEEKEFTVDGAYNIRYEIMKKRIDKATIVGSDNERLTQPGMVAVVYSHSSEADMYRGFFQYLQNIALIDSEIEDHELEALQGLTGLRALRVKVLPDRRSSSRGPDRDIATDLLNS